MEKNRYYVAFIGCCPANFGISTWTMFPSKEEFTEWYSGKMLDGTDHPLKDVYQVIYEGPEMHKAQIACGIRPDHP